jgi:hypothetical protein
VCLALLDDFWALFARTTYTTPLGRTQPHNDVTYRRAVALTVRAINVFFAELGILINKDKCDMGFSLRYLGWILNTKQLTISCPDDKVDGFTKLVAAACGRSSMRARELASFIGKLTWLSFGCPQGCTFLAALWGLLRNVNDRWDLRVRITARAQKDILWWSSNLHLILATGRNLMLYPHIVHSNEIEMFGDACLHACGGFVCDQWF